MEPRTGTASRPVLAAVAPIALAALVLGAIALLIAAAAIVATADGPGAGDAGASIDRSLALPQGTWNGSLLRNATVNDTEDFYSFEFDSAQLVECVVVLAPAASHYEGVRLHIHDRSGAEVVNFTFAGLAAPVRFSSLTNMAFPSLRYYFAVAWHGSAVAAFSVPYNITVRASARQDDAGTRGDVGNSSSRAEELDVGASVHGAIGGPLPQWGKDLNADVADVYEVTPSANRFMVVRATLDAMSSSRQWGFDVRVVDQNDRILQQEPLLRVGDNVTIRQFADTFAPLFVVVVSESEACNYTVSVEEEPPAAIDLFVASINVTPPQPIANRPATITVTFRSTSAAVPGEGIACSIRAGNDELWSDELLFDATGTAVQEVSWNAVYGTTAITARVDILDDVPWETREDNNALTVEATARDPGEDGDGDGDGNGGGMDWVWLALGLIAVCAAIAAAVAYAAIRGRGKPPEGEDGEARE